MSELRRIRTEPVPDDELKKAKQYLTLGLPGDFEGTAEAASIKKMREAMMNEGGLIQVKMAIAESLRNKRIVMIPTGSANSFNLQTLDLNDILKQLGVSKAK